MHRIRGVAHSHVIENLRFYLEVGNCMRLVDLRPCMDRLHTVCLLCLIQHWTAPTHTYEIKATLLN